MTEILLSFIVFLEPRHQRNLHMFTFMGFLNFTHSGFIGDNLQNRLKIEAYLVWLCSLFSLARSRIILCAFFSLPWSALQLVSFKKGVLYFTDHETEQILQLHLKITYRIHHCNVFQSPKITQVPRSCKLENLSVRHFLEPKACENPVFTIKLLFTFWN